MRIGLAGWSTVAASLLLLSTAGCGTSPLGSDEDGGFIILPVEGPDAALDAGLPVPDATRPAGPDAATPAGADASADAGPAQGHRCDPTGGGPYWLVEGETVRVPLRCATGLSLDTWEFSVDPLPDGARIDSGDATLVWTPRLDQAAVYALSVRVASLGEEGAVRIGVADATGVPGNASIADPLRYPEELGLPVMFVSYSGTPNKTYPLAAQVVYRGHTYSAQLKLHGVTSVSYPKNSYGLKFDATDLFDEAAYGLVGRNKIRMTTTFDDNTYVRQRLAYALWTRLDPAHVPVVAYNAVLYLNGRYHGLYLVSDDPDKGLLGIAGLDREGNLYKAVSNDANFDSADQFGEPKLALYQGYDKKEGTPAAGMPGAFDDLEDFVAFTSGASEAYFVSDFARRARLEDFQAYWMLVAYAQASDNVRKNYLLYRDPVTDGPWRYIPWDWNGSFGQDWGTYREPPRTLDYAYNNRLYTRLLTHETTFGLRARFHQVLRGPWAISQVLALYDGFIAEVTPSAERDELRWGALYRSYSGWSDRTDFQDFHGEAAYVRQWLADHARLLEARY